ncbi:MAG TPA: hypothetical protein VGD98_05050 [Ktedonobacteraceae bacterium]
MYLHILEFTYAAEDRSAVELRLSQMDLHGVLISTQQYDEEMFAVLASTRPLMEDQQKLLSYAMLTSCQTKRRFLYRITTTTTSNSALVSFPLGEDNEWYVSTEKMTYLSLGSYFLGSAQFSWLAAHKQSVKWENVFELAPLRANS